MPHLLPSVPAAALSPRRQAQQGAFGAPERSPGHCTALLEGRRGAQRSEESKRALRSRPARRHLHVGL